MELMTPYGHIRILLLEDDPDDAELLEDELREGGLVFALNHVETEEDYVQALREDCPDVILSDYDLATFTGAEALQIRNEQCPETPFILVTGAVGEERAIEILTGGATDYILKRNLARVVPAVSRALQEAYEHRKRKEAEAQRDSLLRDLERRVEERTRELLTEVESRKKAEEILQRYRILAENARDIVLLISQDDGRLLEANAAAAQAYGYAREELLSLSIHDLRGPEAQAMTAEQMEEANQRGILFETIHRRRDGSTFPVEVSSRGETIGGVRTLISVVRDVTRRKEAEAALEESEKRVRTKLESILSPEGDIGGLELSEIIDVETIQSLMDDFYRLAEIPMTIEDLSGKIIVGVGWQEICTRFHRAHPDTCRHCIESDTVLSSGLSPGEFRLYRCRNNMWDIATPLMIGGRQVGNVFSGQFFFEEEPLDYDLFRSQAKQYGFDEKEYLAALDAVPRLSREKLNTAMTFFIKLAGMISKLSYSNIRLARTVAQRDTLTASLEISREDLKRAQSVAKTGSWRLDIRRDELIWSDETYRIFGIPIGTPMTYDSFIAAVHPDDRQYVRQKWTDALKTRFYDIEHRIVATGKVKWVRERAELDLDPEGALLSGFGTVQDVTDRKKIEHDLKRRTAELKAANAELESFSYSVSHDLRAPLRTIEGFSKMLARDLGPEIDDESRRRLTIVRESAERMNHLIDALLSLSRLGRQAVTPARIDMTELFQEVWEELAQSMPERKATFCLEELEDAAGDRALIKQVVLNLLSNALKYTRDRDPALIEVKSAREDASIVFSVKDNGAGFDMRLYDRLFSVFQRLHSHGEFEGTGIGLAIVHRIIRRHGGRVWAESEIEKGSTFYFSLPGAQKGM